VLWQKKRERRDVPAALRKAVPDVLDGRDVLGGWAFLALDEVELNLLTLGEGAEALGLDSGVMDENVAALGLDKSKALRVVEPLDCSGLAICHAYVTFPQLRGWVVDTGAERLRQTGSIDTLGDAEDRRRT
jgi:hypothetical protein